jgi:DNA-binding protein HU-beta
MNKAQLVDALAARIGDRNTAAAAVDGLLETIVTTVGSGESVTLTGFGVFSARSRAARTARNPRTGETVDVPATTVPAFRPGAGFRSAVHGSAGPVPRRAGVRALEPAAPGAAPGAPGAAPPAAEAPPAPEAPAASEAAAVAAKRTRARAMGAFAAGPVPADEPVKASAADGGGKVKKAKKAKKAKKGECADKADDQQGKGAKGEKNAKGSGSSGKARENNGKAGGNNGKGKGAKAKSKK